MSSFESIIQMSIEYRSNHNAASRNNVALALQNSSMDETYHCNCCSYRIDPSLQSCLHSCQVGSFPQTELRSGIVLHKCEGPISANAPRPAIQFKDIHTMEDVLLEWFLPWEDKAGRMCDPVNSYKDKYVNGQGSRGGWDSSNRTKYSARRKIVKAVLLANGKEESEVITEEDVKALLPAAREYFGKAKYGRLRNLIKANVQLPQKMYDTNGNPLRR